MWILVVWVRFVVGGTLGAAVPAGVRSSCVSCHAGAEAQEELAARIVAEELTRLGFKVATGIARTGVVGTIRGKLPGQRSIGLRADMDALPVTEQTGLPFASKAKSTYLGKEVPVTHSCGHDAHVAMLMGAAEALAGMKATLPGTVKFIFQPAEEGAPVEPDANGKVPSFGAKAMVEAGVLKDVQAIYGLHITANLPSGMAGYRSGPLMAGSNNIHIHVEGKGGHGSSPWSAVDPIVAASQVVLGLQTVVSRQLNISKEPAVLSIGQINGGNRENIVPESVEMVGTLRAFDETMRADAKERITRTAESIASASGATAEVSFGPSAYPVTTNPEALTEMMAPVLKKVSGGKAMQTSRLMASEDFSEFQKVVPGLYIILGAAPEGKTPATAAPNHNPAFDFDESMMQLGTKAMAGMALEFLSRQGN